jgi:hypothetical protein
MVGAVLSLGEGNATTRFYQSNCWRAGSSLSVRGARATSEQATHHWGLGRKFAFRLEPLA